MKTTDVSRAVAGLSQTPALSPSVDATRQSPLWRRGAASIGAALGLALVVWAIARALGVEIASPQMGTNPVAPIGMGHVAAATITAAVAGLAGMAVLERLVPARARMIWLVVAGIVLLASLGAPLTGAGITASTRVALVAMHLVVGGALVTGLPSPSIARRSPRSSRQGGRHEQVH